MVVQPTVYIFNSGKASCLQFIFFTHSSFITLLIPVVMLLHIGDPMPISEPMHTGAKPIVGTQSNSYNCTFRYLAIEQYYYLVILGTYLSAIAGYGKPPFLADLVCNFNKPAKSCLLTAFATSFNSTCARALL